MMFQLVAVHSLGRVYVFCWLFDPCFGWSQPKRRFFPAISWFWGFQRVLSPFSMRDKSGGDNIERWYKTQWGKRKRTGTIPWWKRLRHVKLNVENISRQARTWNNETVGRMPNERRKYWLKNPRKGKQGGSQKQWHNNITKTQGQKKKEKTDVRSEAIFQRLQVGKGCCIEAASRVCTERSTKNLLSTPRQAGNSRGYRMEKFEKVSQHNPGCNQSDLKGEIIRFLNILRSSQRTNICQHLSKFSRFPKLNIMSLHHNIFYLILVHLCWQFFLTFLSLFCVPVHFPLTSFISIPMFCHHRPSPIPWVSIASILQVCFLSCSSSRPPNTNTYLMCPLTFCFSGVLLVVNYDRPWATKTIEGHTLRC